MALAEDGSDMDLWLPRRERGRVGKHRLAHGDVARDGELLRSFAFPLDFLLRRGSLEPRQHEAGGELHRLWYHGCLASRYAQLRYGEVRSASDREVTSDLGRRYRLAMLAVRGMPERRVAYAVCCLGESLTGLSKERHGKAADGTPLTRLKEFDSARTAQRKGMERLKSALDDLADHFGL